MKATRRRIRNPAQCGSYAILLPNSLVPMHADGAAQMAAKSLPFPLEIEKALTRSLTPLSRSRAGGRSVGPPLAPSLPLSLPPLSGGGLMRYEIETPRRGHEAAAPARERTARIGRNIRQSKERGPPPPPRSRTARASLLLESVERATLFMIARSRVPTRVPTL